ncbi:MAG: TonB-dependent receptor [Bacteroidia bacterium]
MKQSVFILSFLITNILLSQEIYVVDENSRQGIPYAVISVFNQHKKLLLQKITDDKGYLQLDAEKFSTEGISQISIYAFGYQTKEIQTNVWRGKKLIFTLNKLSHRLDEVVITGEPVPVEKQSSVYYVKNISEKKIQSMGAQNLKDILLNENNIQITSDPVLGTGINMLGLSGQAVKILVDGVPIIGRLNGNIDLSQINLNNVQKVEIIEGPMAVKYGTDAMGGVINIITKKSSDKKFSDKLLTYYESNGTYNINNTILWNISNHQLNISLGRNFFDGWRPDEKPFYFEKVKIADTTRFKLWKPREQYYVNIQDNINWNRSSLGIYADAFYETITDRGKPFSPYYESSIDNYYRTYRNTQRITFKKYFKENYYLDFIAARNYYLRIKNAYYNDLTSLEKQLTTNPGDQDTSRYLMYMSRSSITKNFSTNHRLECGYDVYREQANSSIIKNKRAEQTDVAGFLTYSGKITKHLTIKPALRFAYNSLYNTPVIPSLNALYNFSHLSNDTNTKKTSSFRISVARGFRTPSLKELFLSFVDINHNIIGNPDLKPEISTFYNICYDLQWNGEKTHIKTEVGLFFNDVKNVINLGMINATQYSYLNIDRIQTTGGSIGNNIQFNEFSLSPKISLIGKKFEIQQKSEFYFYPEIIFNLNYQYKKQNIGVNAFSKSSGKVPYVVINSDNSNSLAYLPDVYWIDVNIYKNLMKDKFQITLGVKNLLNYTSLSINASATAHSSSQVLLGNGRTYFMQMILKL